MFIERVTITGADDNTDIKDLFELTKKYPFVEWGILFSPSREGLSRYPSIYWIEKLYNESKVFISEELKCSAHLCGDYSRQVIEEGISSKYLSKVKSASHLFKRIQLNFNSQNTSVNFDKLKYVFDNTFIPLIFQYNKSNKEICDKIIDYLHKTYPIYSNKANFLYDGSGGRGVIPEQWKDVIPYFFTGYAGGLNPNNIEEELNKINSVANINADIWIDTETGVRTDDKLDLDKVDKFLGICQNEYII